ncbi:uncharacterized protein Bfra_001166, partial [Botrytis fragariae]
YVDVELTLTLKNLHHRGLDYNFESPFVPPRDSLSYEYCSILVPMAYYVIKSSKPESNNGTIHCTGMTVDRLRVDGARGLEKIGYNKPRSIRPYKDISLEFLIRTSSRSTISQTISCVFPRLTVSESNNL